VRVRRLAAILVGAAVLVAGCGPASRPPTAAAPSSAPVASASVPSAPGSPAAAGTPRCGDGGPIAVRTPDGVTLSAAVVGSGRRGVVLVPELGSQGMCGWTDYADYLAGRGFRVLVFDHRCKGDSDCPAAGSQPAGLMTDVAAASTALRSAGATRIVLLGASQGASEAVISGARPPTGVTAVAALSADELTTMLAAPPYPTTPTAAAPALKVPAFFAVAADDAYVSLADTRALVRSAGRRAQPLVEVPGSRHGWDLLAGAGDGGGEPQNTKLVAFLTPRTA
jgi:pimeloyl-ACP methyl ester carboxylesterase